MKAHSALISNGRSKWRCGKDSKGDSSVSGSDLEIHCQTCGERFESFRSLCTHRITHFRKRSTLEAKPSAEENSAALNLMFMSRKGRSVKEIDLTNNRYMSAVAANFASRPFKVFAMNRHSHLSDREGAESESEDEATEDVDEENRINNNDNNENEGNDDDQVEDETQNSNNNNNENENTNSEDTVVFVTEKRNDDQHTKNDRNQRQTRNNSTDYVSSDMPRMTIPPNTAPPIYNQETVKARLKWLQDQKDKAELHLQQQAKFEDDLAAERVEWRREEDERIRKVAETERKVAETELKAIESGERLLKERQDRQRNQQAEIVRQREVERQKSELAHLNEPEMRALFEAEQTGRVEEELRLQRINDNARHAQIDSDARIKRKAEREHIELERQAAVREHKRRVSIRIEQQNKIWGEMPAGFEFIRAAGAGDGDGDGAGDGAGTSGAGGGGVDSGNVGNGSGGARVEEQ